MVSRANGARVALVAAAIVVAALLIDVPPGPIAELDEPRSYDPPEPSPTPIVGLHDYAVVRTHPAPVPTAAPAPSPSVRKDRQRRERRSAAGHTSSGSGARTKRPNHNAIGKASWHATGRSGRYAAACKPLRDAMGPGWRGQSVIVSHRGKLLGVVLNDWCGSHDKLIDLSDEAFRYFAPLSRGVIRVGVGW